MLNKLGKQITSPWSQPKREKLNLPVAVIAHHEYLDLAHLSVEDIGQCILENIPVTIVMQETNIVMVVEEVPQHRDVLEVLLVCRDAIVDVLHRPLLLEGVGELVEHGVVEGGGEGALVPGDVLRVPVEDLPDGVDPGRLRILGPKVLGDFRHGVNPDAVKVVCLDCIVDPLLEGRANKGI